MQTSSRTRASSAERRPNAHRPPVFPAPAAAFAADLSSPRRSGRSIPTLRLAGVLALLCLLALHLAGQPSQSAAIAAAPPASSPPPAQPLPEDAQITPDAGPNAETETRPAATIPAVPLERRAENVAILTIRGPIDAVTSVSFERRFNQALDQNADAIVVDLDTPGGELGAVREITTLIRSTNKRTTAWINPQAISGGAIIAIACDEIVTAPGGIMGDAGVITLDTFATAEGLAPAERAKATSIALAEVQESARRNGYDEVLVQAFVSLRVETWEVVDTRTGERYFLNEEEYRALFNEDPPRGNAYFSSGGVLKGEKAENTTLYKDDAGAPRRPTEGSGIGAGGFVPGSDALTPGMIAAVNDAVETQSTRPDFNREDPDNYRYVRYATDGGAYLTMSEQAMVELGFAREVVADDQELKQFLGATNLARLDQSASESVVQFMTQGISGMVVRVVLIIVFLLALFIEMSVPGVGVAGAISFAALMGLVLPPMLIDASAWWTGAAILIGIGLLAIEAFVIPGTGVAGISGLVLVFAGLVGTFAGAGQLFPGSGDGGGASFTWAASIVLLSIFAAGAGMYLFSRYTKHVPIASKLVLSTAQRSEMQSRSSMLEAMEPLGGKKSGGQGVAFPGGPPCAPVGATGQTTTRLMPAGRAEFAGELIDVVSVAGPVEAGARVRVVSATTYRVGVEPVDDDDLIEPAASAQDPPRDTPAPPRDTPDDAVESTDANAHAPDQSPDPEPDSNPDRSTP